MESLIKFAELFTKNTNLIFISLIFGLIGTSLNPRNRTIWSWVVSLICAVFIGVFTGQFLESSGFQEEEAYVFVGIISIIAKDVVEFIILSAMHVKNRSKNIVDRIIEDKLPGSTQQEDTDNKK